MVIVLYKGGRGRGKTLTMVKDGYKFFNKGFKVLRNFHCTFGEEVSNDEILNLDKHSDIHNAVVMIDEIQIFFDSRRSMRKQNLSFSNFIQQIRKRNITLLVTTQYTNAVDLRLRQHVDIIAVPRFIKDLNVCEVLYIDITAYEDMDMFNSEPPLQKIVYNARPIFDLYRTEEMII